MKVTGEGVDGGAGLSLRRAQRRRGDGEGIADRPADHFGHTVVEGDDLEVVQRVSPIRPGHLDQVRPRETYRIAGETAGEHGGVDAGIAIQVVVAAIATHPVIAAAALEDVGVAQPGQDVGSIAAEHTKAEAAIDRIAGQLQHLDAGQCQSVADRLVIEHRIVQPAAEAGGIVGQIDHGGVGTITAGDSGVLTAQCVDAAQPIIALAARQAGHLLDAGDRAERLAGHGEAVCPAGHATVHRDHVAGLVGEAGIASVKARAAIDHIGAEPAI